MIVLRPYRPEDIALIKPRAYERELMEITNWRATAEEKIRGIAITAWEDDVPVGAGGIAELWQGVGEVWLYLSPWFEMHPKTGYQTVKSMLGKLIEVGQWRRLQAPISVFKLKNRRFIEHLGFHPEGTMERWGPDGRDYILYAMVAETGNLDALQKSCR